MECNLQLKWRISLLSLLSSAQAYPSMSPIMRAQLLTHIKLLLIPFKICLNSSFLNKILKSFHSLSKCWWQGQAFLYLGFCRANLQQLRLLFQDLVLLVLHFPLTIFIIRLFFVTILIFIIFSSWLKGQWTISFSFLYFGSAWLLRVPRIFLYNVYIHLV